MKKFLSLALVLILVLGFATMANAESGKRTIKFWHCMGGAIGDAVQANVDAFNASQDEIEVVSEFQGGYDDCLIKVKAAVPAGEGPDVFQMFEMATAYLANVDWIVPFSDMLEEDPFLDMEADINGALRNYYTIDGKFLCLPYNPSSPLMYYNKTAFDAAGITEVPTTFAEIEAIADQLVSGSDLKYAMGLSIYGWFFECLLVGSGNYYVDNENGRAGVATKIEYDTNGGGALVMETWKRLVDEGVCFNYGVDNSAAKAAFMAGDTGITFESTAQLTTITNGASFEVGAAFIPSVLDERVDRAIVGGGNLWMVKTDDEQRKADCWTFMKYMASPEPAAAFSMATGYYAANTKAYEVPAYVEYLESHPNAQVALDQLGSSELSHLTGSLFTGVSTELRQIWQEEMDLYLQGVYSTEEALAEMASRSNAALATYNAAN